MKKIIATTAALFLAGCAREADVASENLSRAADSFEITRRIVFINGITNDYMLEITGLCAIGSGSAVKAVTVTCKTGPGIYKKHYMGLSDNVTYVAEQMEPAPANTYQYRVNFKPSTIIPSFEVNR